MSNLSELLPAGAGAKSAKFVASGTLASGQAVGLKTDGKVSAISAQVSSDSVLNPLKHFTYLQHSTQLIIK